MWWLCTKARAKRQGPLSQCERCFVTVRTACSCHYYRPSPIPKTPTLTYTEKAFLHVKKTCNVTSQGLTVPEQDYVRIPRTHFRTEIRRPFLLGMERRIATPDLHARPTCMNPSMVRICSAPGFLHSAVTKTMESAPPQHSQCCFVSSLLFSTTERRMATLLSLISTSGASVGQRDDGSSVYPDVNIAAECYAIPYGWPGFISTLISMYAVVSVFKSRTPLWPSRTPRHHIFNGFLATVQFGVCTALLILTYLQCGRRGRPDLVLMLGSVHSFVILTTLSLVHLSAARRKTELAKKRASTSAEYELLNPETANEDTPRAEATAKPASATTTDAASSDDDIDDSDETALLQPKADCNDDANTPPANTPHTSNTTPSQAKPPITTTTTTNPSPLPKKHYLIRLPMPTVRAALGAYFSILIPTTLLTTATYLTLPRPEIDQTSFAAKTVWVILIGISDIAVLWFIFALFMPIYRRYKAKGWQGLKAMTLAQGLGWYWVKVGGKYKRMEPKPWKVALCAGVATMVMANWVLAMAAGGNWGFPGPGEGRGGLVAAYWGFFVVSKATLFSF